jgi:hypothetical protein
MQQSAETLVESWKPFFEQAYARDAANARAQSFDEYWRWVKIYLLAGGSGQPGWMSQVESIVSRVAGAPGHEVLRETLYRIGRLVAAEWSKERAYRKIHSTPWQGRPNLVELGRRLQGAAGRDRGEGQALEAALAEIERDLEAALRH